MLGTNSSDDLVMTNNGDVQIVERRIFRHVEESYIDAAPAQLVETVINRIVLQRQLNVRMDPEEFRYRLRELCSPHKEEDHRADVHLTAKQLGALEHVLLQRVDFTQYLFGAVDEESSCRGKLDPATVPDKERYADALLEQGNGLGKRGLSNPKLLGSVRKMHGARNRHDVAQLAKIHA
jgi:hypothetical protein